MESLDRAYVINGDDLRLALGGDGGHPKIVQDPRTVAEYILGKFATPLDTHRGVITQALLERALDGTRMDFHAGGLPDGCIGTVDSPREVAAYLFKKIRQLRESDEAWGAAQAPQEPPVDAHVCCEHVAADPELAAMAAVLAALGRLRPDECSRVLDWARRRFAVEPPF